VDVLARRYNVVARFNGGANAGHTIVVDGRKFAFHLLPCGLLHEKKINIIGNGVVVHIPSLLKELKMLDEAGVPYNEQLKVERLRWPRHARPLSDLARADFGPRARAV
jgi:adenylosuccinate synthase